MTDKRIELIATFPIYKSFRKINTRFKKKINSRLSKLNKRFRPKYHAVVEELNQFVFSSVITENKELFEIENRTSIENDLLEIYDKFSSKTLKELRKHIVRDPEFRVSKQALVEAQKDLGVDISVELSKLDHFEDNVIDQIKDIFKESKLVLWDLPGDQVDRIIIGQEVINREDDSIDVLGIGIIADELTLASLGKNHVPMLCKQISEIMNIIDILPVKIDTFHESFHSIKDEEERAHLIKVASVFLGKLLGIREPLLLAHKQLERYLELQDEIEIESEDIGSDFLASIYNRLIDRELIEESIEFTDHINELLTEYSDKIRQLYSRIEEVELAGHSSSQLSDFLHFVADVYYVLEDFRFITDVFQDIPSYTSMGGGIAIEADEEEKAELPEGMMIYASNIFKTFPLLNSTVYALRGVDLQIKTGEFVAIMGPSGSGKTTLLNILSGLDTPDRGEINVAGLDINHATEKELTIFRRNQIAFIYQSYNLLPNMTNVENVRLPADLGVKKDIGNHHKRATELMEDVGIGEYTDGFPLRLSGGQQQRVTIARALMNKPDIIFADEPTGDLDSTTGNQIMKIIDTVQSEGDVTVVLVTHDKKIASRADRIINMRDGKIVTS